MGTRYPLIGRMVCVCVCVCVCVHARVRVCIGSDHPLLYYRQINVCRSTQPLDRSLRGFNSKIFKGGGALSVGAPPTFSSE